MCIRDRFAFKLESCRKSHRFLPSQILRGVVPLKFVLALTPQHSGTSGGKVLWSYYLWLAANTLHFKPILDPPLKKNVKGTHVPGGERASKTWSFSSACRNLGVQHRYRGRNMAFRKSRFGWVNISRVISNVGGPKFTNFFYSTREGLIVLDNAVYRLSMSLSSPEIFATKLEICRKTY